MRLRAALAAAAVAGLIGACGGDDEPAASTGPPAQPLSTSICSPVSYGGPGRPRFLLVNSSAFQGIYQGHGVQTAQAIKMVLAERGWRAGPYNVGLQVCEETSAKTGQPSPGKCARNARAFAENPAVLAMVGPLTSYCATRMLATLNAAPGGPLAVISGGNSYVGLTRAGPGTASDEPGRYQPTKRLGYARLAPSDDAQGAAAALVAQRERRRRAFVVEHDDPYGLGLAAAFRAAAGRLGLAVAGTTRWSERARSYRPLARRVRAARPDFVFISGDVSANGPQLVADLSATLSRDVQLMAGDSFNVPDPLVEAAGAGAEGFLTAIAVLPNDQLPAAGRKFAADFERRFDQRPCCFSVHDAQAARILLDAIAGSGGSRARVAEQVMRTRVRGGLVGDFAIDRHGDTTLNTLAIYRIRAGKLRFEGAVAPAPALLGRQ